MERMLVYLSLNCLVLGSGFYLTQIVSLSPIYPLLVFSLFFSTWAFLSNKILINPASFATKSALAVCVLHSCFYLYFVSPFNTFLGYFFNFIFAFISLWLMPFFTKKELERIGFRLIDFTILLGSIEALIRWLYPFQSLKPEFLDYVRESGSTFYLYKFNSIMYQDSNFVASWILVITVFAIEQFGAKRCGIRTYLLSALLALTICRSAILCFGLYLICKIIFKHFKSKLSKIVVFSTLLLGALAGLSNMIINDASFQSKLAIFGLVMANYASSLDFVNFLFGVGLSNSKDVLGGITAHNFIMELLIDAGLIGLLSMFTLLVGLAKTSGSKGGSILTVFIISGMSFAPFTIPYLFVILSLAGILARNYHRNDRK